MIKSAILATFLCQNQVIELDIDKKVCAKVLEKCINQKAPKTKAEQLKAAKACMPDALKKAKL